MERELIYGVYSSWENRPTRESAVSGNHEFWAADERSGELRHYGSCARTWHKFLRHSELVWRQERRGRHRADYWPLVRAGWWSAREGRAGDQGVQCDGGLAQPVAAVGAQHSSGQREQPQTLAD